MYDHLVFSFDAFERPSRSLNTLIVNELLKQELVADIERFWHRNSPKYYALRGIPHRQVAAGVVTEWIFFEHNGTIGHRAIKKCKTPPKGGGHVATSREL